MSEIPQRYHFKAEPRMLRPKAQNLKVQTINIQMYRNLMFDQKIVRGNTNSIYFKRNKETEKSETQPIRVKKNSKIYDAVRKVKLINSLSRTNMNDLKNKKKKRMGVYVEHEERLSTNLPESLDICIQTDKLKEKPVEDYKYEFPYGTDFSIQVDEKELFDFEKEVQPLVETLKARILKESLQEVWREQEDRCFTSINKDLSKDIMKKKQALNEFLIKEKEKKADSRKKYKEYEEKHKEKMEIQSKMISRDYSKRFVSKLKEEFYTMMDIYQNIKSEEILILNDSIRPYIEKKALIKLSQEKETTKRLTEMFGNKQEEFKAKHKKVVDACYEKIRKERERLEKEERERLKAQKIRRQKRVLKKRKNRLNSIVKYIKENEELLKENQAETIIEDCISYGNNRFMGIFGGLLGIIIPCISIVNEYMNPNKLKTFLDQFFEGISDLRFNIYFKKELEDELKNIKIESIDTILNSKKRSKRERAMQMMTNYLINISESSSSFILNDLIIKEEELQKLNDPDYEEEEEEPIEETNAEEINDEKKEPKIIKKRSSKLVLSPKEILYQFFWTYLLENKPSNINLNYYKEKTIEEKIKRPNIFLITDKPKPEIPNSNNEIADQSNDIKIELYNEFKDIEKMIEMKYVEELDDRKGLRNSLAQKDSFFYLNLKLQQYIQTKLIESFKTTFNIKEDIEERITSVLHSSFSESLKAFVNEFKSQDEKNEILLLNK